MAAKRHERSVIVNADDFGQSRGVNRGVIEAHEHGIVTSASLMVRWPAAVEAAAYAREHPDLSLGLHFDFSEWAYRNGKWIRLYQVVAENNPKTMAEEVSRQLAAFRRLVGRDPTHLDSHQHAHRGRSVRRIFIDLARRLRVPLRSVTSEVRYCGDFYGQTSNGGRLPSLIGVKALIKLLAKLRPGFTELGCHPGEGDDLDSMYRAERVKEVKTLCDPRVRAAMIRLGVQLRSFLDVAAMAGRGNPKTANSSTETGLKLGDRRTGRRSTPCRY